MCHDFSARAGTNLYAPGTTQPQGRRVHLQGHQDQEESASVSIERRSHRRADGAPRRAKRDQTAVARLQSGAAPFRDSARGLPWGPDRFSRVFSRQMRRLKINVTFHGLRHTFATVLLREGVSMKLVSDMLGHETIAITADIYTHVPEAMQHEAVRPSWLRCRKEGIVSDDLTKRVRQLDSFSLFR